MHETPRHQTVIFQGLTPSSEGVLRYTHTPTTDPDERKTKMFHTNAYTDEHTSRLVVRVTEWTVVP